MYINVIITDRKRSCSQGGGGLHPEGVCIKRDLDPEGVCIRGEAASKRVYLRGEVCRRVCLQGALHPQGSAYRVSGWLGRHPPRFRKGGGTHPTITLSSHHL